MGSRPVDNDVSDRQRLLLLALAASGSYYGDGSRVEDLRVLPPEAVFEGIGVTPLPDCLFAVSLETLRRRGLVREISYRPGRWSLTGAGLELARRLVQEPR